MQAFRVAFGLRTQPRVNQIGVSTARGREFESFERESECKRGGYARGDECGVANRERGHIAGVAQRRVVGGLTTIVVGDDFASSR